MAKASASCPAINEMPIESSSDLCSTSSPQSDNDCESDDGVVSGVSRKERLFALKSIRRDRKREKDQQKKLQSNNISMDDFLSKQTEFKIWLKEEKSKQAKDMTSPKLKSYFKTFVKHWNRKKLNQKYYRGAELAETPQPSTVRQRFIFTDDTCSNTSLFPCTINLSMEGMDSLSSPFSTFGKSPLGLPIANRTPRKPAINSLKIRPDPVDDHDKENQQEKMEKDEIARANQKPLSADSDLTELPRCYCLFDPADVILYQGLSLRTNSSLYEVSVLSWTSKGELSTVGKSPTPKPRQVKPVPLLHCPTLSEPQSAVREMHLPYQDVQHTGSSTTSNHSKRQLLPMDYSDPGYVDPDFCFREDRKSSLVQEGSIQNTPVNHSKQLQPLNYTDPGYTDPDLCFSEDSKYISVQDGSTSDKEKSKLLESEQAIYAVPIKKKKVAGVNKGNSYISRDVSSAPPPIPPKRKSPLECWPYDNSLMGTNIPAPCYSMNKAIQKQQSSGGELHAFISNIKKSSITSRHNSLNNHVNPDHDDVEIPYCIMNSMKSDPEILPPKISSSRQAHVCLTTDRTETPPPQLVPIVDGSYRSKNAVSVNSCKPFLYETTFSANDTESPIKTPRPVVRANLPLTNSLETSTSHHQFDKLSSNTGVDEQGKTHTGKKPWNTDLHQVPDLNTTYTCEKTSFTTSSNNDRISSTIGDESTTHGKELTGVSEDRDVRSPILSHQESEQYETDIDDLDEDDDDSIERSVGSDDMGRGFIETDLDQVLEKVTRQKSASTHWLVNTGDETTV